LKSFFRSWVGSIVLFDLNCIFRCSFDASPIHNSKRGPTAYVTVRLHKKNRAPPRARKRKFSVENNESFRNCDSSRPRAGWSMRLVLVRATLRAEVDVISVQRCQIARAIFP